jgi:hypothetical protein
MRAHGGCAVAVWVCNNRTLINPLNLTVLKPIGCSRLTRALARERDAERRFSFGGRRYAASNKKSDFVFGAQSGSDRDRCVCRKLDSAILMVKATKDRS